MLCVLDCVRGCVFMCVSGVCGDSCSLNSIIVSNWGLPSQCVVMKSTLSQLLTGRTCRCTRAREQARVKVQVTGGKAAVIA